MSNRRGFTLIELLVTIAILGLVVGFSTYGILSQVDKSKQKALALTESNIKKSARLYSSEVDESKWQDITIPIIDNENPLLDEGILERVKEEANNYKFYCVTIQELINKGLLKGEDIDNSNSFNANTTIIVKKNKVTFTIDKEEVIPPTDSGEYNDMAKINNALCSGTIIEEQPPTPPQIDSATSYTSEINVEYTEASYQEGSSSRVESHTCLLSKNKDELFKNSTNVTKEEGTDGSCTFDGLVADTTYYLKVCMDSNNTKNNNNSYAACSTIEPVNTKRITAPNIKFNSTNTITIEYFNENIKDNAIHGFYTNSSITGESDTEIYDCGSDSKLTNCSDTATRQIEIGKYYKVTTNTVNIEYDTPQKDTKVTIKGTTSDQTNEKSSTSTFTIKAATEIVTHTITFYKGSADKIGNSTGNKVEVTCTPKKGEKSCTITTPTITRSGYTIKGWNQNSNATGEELGWTSGAEVTISSSASYYPITSKTVIITFDKNNASSISSTKESCTMYNSDTSCNVKTPSITAPSCNLKVGWSSSSSTSIAEYNENYTISVNANKTYYAIVRTTTRLSVPKALDLVYNGEKQNMSILNDLSATKNLSSANYTKSGTTSATNVGSYEAFVTPNKGYCWTDGTNTKKPITWKIVPFEVSLNISGVPKSSFSKTYSITSTINNFKSLACNTENCQELSSSTSCSASSCGGALAWSGKKPTISWSSNASSVAFTVQYDTNCNTSNKYVNFNTSTWGTLSTSGSSGSLTVSSDGHRVIKISAINGSAKITLSTYLSLDFVAPTITLPSGSSSSWGMNNTVYINHYDYGSKLYQSVNAYSTNTVPESDISCINGKNDAKNFCLIDNSQKTYGANISTDADPTACTTSTYCYSNYYILWACSSDSVGNKTCARRTNPKATQINYTYLVKDE